MKIELTTSKLSKEEKLALSFGLAATLRGAFHLFYFQWTWAEVIFDMYYLLVFYFSLLFGLEYVVKWLFRVHLSDELGFYTGYAKYWVFLFPAVPLLTILTHSSYNNYIPFFQYIPGFIVTNNFLPTGMIYIIPLMLLFTMKHARLYFNLHWLKLFFAISGVFLFTYVLYYQWLYGVQIRFRSLFSPDTAMAFYACILLSLLLTVQIILRLRHIIVHEYWYKLTLLMLYTYGFILANRIFQYVIQVYA